jgi:hypothetical protein
MFRLIKTSSRATLINFYLCLQHYNLGLVVRVSRLGLGGAPGVNAFRYGITTEGGSCQTSGGLEYIFVVAKRGGALHITTPSEDVAIPSCGSQNLS